MQMYPLQSYMYPYNLDYTWNAIGLFDKWTWKCSAILFIFTYMVFLLSFMYEFFFSQIRVPTHDKGTFISWEFVTDSFDIGFGLYFEWSHPDTTEMTVHVSRGNSDDEGETDEAEDALKEEQPSM